MHDLEFGLDPAQPAETRRRQPLCEEIVEGHGNADLTFRNGESPQPAGLTGKDDLACPLPLNAVSTATDAQLRDVSVPLAVDHEVAVEPVGRRVGLKFVR